MSLYEWAHSILLSEDLDVKLTPIKLSGHNFNSQDQYVSQYSKDILAKGPIRSSKHQMNNRQDKFPKRGSFAQEENRAKAMHFFANHELLAMEMMATAIIYFPTNSEKDHKIKIGIANALIDEQKHFRLYRKRMNELGVDFGDFSINDFFWKYMTKIESLEQFLCMMSLTFEAANLDFSLYYFDCYQEFDDEQSAKIMKTVYEDEISHVALGSHWLNLKAQNQSKSLWKYYLENLPNGLSPARGKGIHFDVNGRKRAGLDHDFLKNSENYKDQFNVVNRSSWS